MTKKSVLFTSTAVIVAVIAGFFIGVQVQAGSVAPGSADDPLVAKSFLDEQVELRVVELEEELAQLRSRANQLERLVEDLSKKLGVETD